MCGEAPHTFPVTTYLLGGRRQGSRRLGSGSTLATSDGQTADQGGGTVPNARVCGVPSASKTPQMLASRFGSDTKKFQKRVKSC